MFDQDRPIKTRHDKDANEVSKALIGYFEPDLILRRILLASNYCDIFCFNMILMMNCSNYTKNRPFF